MPKTLTSITQDEATRVIATVEAEVSAIDVNLPVTPDREANRPWGLALEKTYSQSSLETITQLSSRVEVAWLMIRSSKRTWIMGMNWATKLAKRSRWQCSQNKSAWVQAILSEGREVLSSHSRGIRITPLMWSRLVPKIAQSFSKKRHIYSGRSSQTRASMKASTTGK